MARKPKVGDVTARVGGQERIYRGGGLIVPAASVRLLPRAGEREREGSEAGGFVGGDAEEA